MTRYPSETDLVRAEIAAAAARMIAEDGADYSTAKRKAARQILGDAKVRGDILPDNAQIEDEVRQYNELFLADTQPVRLLRLRELALQVMDEFAGFNPHLTGAVLNGTAGEHSDIHLHLFVDSPKDVEIHLLNRNVQFEVSESASTRRSEAIETVSFLWQGEGVHLTLFGPDDVRGSAAPGVRRTERADVGAVRKLVLEAGQ